jgi:hypothetical protein
MAKVTIPTINTDQGWTMTGKWQRVMGRRQPQREEAQKSGGLATSGANEEPEASPPKGKNRCGSAKTKGDRYPAPTDKAIQTGVKEWLDETQPNANDWAQRIDYGYNPRSEHQR